MQKKKGMPKARPRKRVQTRSEQDHLILRRAGSRRYLRAGSPELIRGEAGTARENIRGRFSEPDLRDFVTDREAMARASGRRSKLTARVAALRKTVK